MDENGRRRPPQFPSYIAISAGMVCNADAQMLRKDGVIMKKRILPNGLEVFPVALGAMDFGTTTSREAAFAV